MVPPSASDGRPPTCEEPIFFRITRFILSMLITVIVLTTFPDFAFTAAKGNAGLPATSAEVAMLKWKSSFDNQSQSSLSTWQGKNACSNNWIGITCRQPGIVTDLALALVGLRGTLMDLDFVALPSLVNLDLSFNSFHGPIPSSIAKLSKLLTLDLSFNRLSGRIPLIIVGLTSLKNLNLNGNHFSGSIPKEIGMLKSLSDLVLSNNSLTGHIPNSIGNLGNLTFLYLWKNNLSEEIPQ